MHHLFGLVLGHVGDVDRVLLAAEPLLVLMDHLHAVPCNMKLVKRHFTKFFLQTKLKELFVWLTSVAATVMNDAPLRYKTVTKK